jgi:hypothetical protein
MKVGIMSSFQNFCCFVQVWSCYFKYIIFHNLMCILSSDETTLACFVGAVCYHGCLWKFHAIICVLPYLLFCILHFSYDSPETNGYCDDSDTGILNQLYVSGMKTHPCLHMPTPHMSRGSSLAMLASLAKCFIPWNCCLICLWLNIPACCHHP